MATRGCKGGPAGAGLTMGVWVNAYNDAPAATVPGPMDVMSHAATPITGISVADIDGGRQLVAGHRRSQPRRADHVANNGSELHGGSWNNRCNHDIHRLSG